VEREDSDVFFVVSLSDSSSRSSCTREKIAGMLCEKFIVQVAKKTNDI
jgi:hypothetical protein